MKCAVSDFDRTFYVDSRVSPRNLEAVRAWQAAGNWFVIATGRNEASLRQLLDEYGVKPDALILNNGAVILDREGRELFFKPIEKRTAEEMCIRDRFRALRGVREARVSCHDGGRGGRI